MYISEEDLHRLKKIKLDTGPYGVNGIIHSPSYRDMEKEAQTTSQLLETLRSLLTQLATIPKGVVKQRLKELDMDCAIYDIDSVIELVQEILRRRNSGVRADW